MQGACRAMGLSHRKRAAICHYVFVQLRGAHTTKRKRNVSYGCWLIIKCQCRFIISNKWTILVADVDNGEVLNVRGQGVWMDFAFNLKSDYNFLKADPCTLKSSLNFSRH